MKSGDRSPETEVRKTEGRNLNKEESSLARKKTCGKVKIPLAPTKYLLSCKKFNMAFKFENLVVWQKAVDLSDMVSQIAKNFPKDEIYVLTSQIKRAADSVSLNIAEGSTGQSNQEFKRFLGIALRSNIEVVGCIYLAKRRAYLKEEDFQRIYKLCEELLFKIIALRNKLN
jgi:four helix bundle protein